MSSKLVNNKMIAWIVFEHPPSSFQQQEHGPSALEDYIYRQQCHHDQLFNADKKSVLCGFLKGSTLPFSSKPKFARCTKTHPIFIIVKVDRISPCQFILVFFHWQTKGKDEICYWVLPPKNKDKQSPRKISLPETKQKKLLKLLVVFFWKFNVGLLQTLLHQEAREKVVEKIISNKGFKIKLLKMKQKNLSLQIQEPEILILNQLWNLEPKADILWVKANLMTEKLFSAFFFQIFLFLKKVFRSR